MRKSIFSGRILAFAVFLILLAFQGHATTLDQAKQDGLVGERADGYIGLVDTSAGSDVQRLVADINAKRREEYQRIAQKNGIAITQVEALAGKKAIERTRSGGWVLKNGGWRKK